MGMGGGGGGSNTGQWFQMMEAAQARAMENMRQERIKKGTEGIDRQFAPLEDTNAPFYERYGGAIQDFYKPQLQKQYADANKELTYRLADAGTLRSSAAADATADLNQQNDMNIANMNNKIDSAKGDLRNRVASEKNTAINQLYATEDPNQALTTALNGVKQIDLAAPDLSPLANIFNVATVGAANAMKAWQGGGGMDQNQVGGAPNAPGFGNSGKTVGSWLS